MERRAKAGRVSALSTLLFGAACAGFAVADDQIGALSDAQLGHELISASANSPEYVGYDASYRPKLVRELCKRRKWDEDTTAKILERSIWVGATKAQLLASWGFPAATTESVGALGNHQTMRYGTNGSTRYLVDLTDGKVTGWTKFTD